MSISTKKALGMLLVFNILTCILLLPQVTGKPLTECVNDIGINIGEYDETHYFCCSGRIISRMGPAQGCCAGKVFVKGPSQQCCGLTGGSQQLYDKNSQVCCDHAVYEGDTCCGGRGMDSSTHTCCYGNPVEGRGSCCGRDTLYDPESEKCCSMGSQNYSPHPPETARVIPYSDFHKSSVQRSQIECCGLQSLYNTVTEQCCNNEVFPGGPFQQCCGDTSNDTRTTICCNGTPHSLEDGKTKCCAATPYNPAQQTCCNGVLSSISNGKCCWSEAYSPSTASCCGGHLNPSIPSIDKIQDCCRAQSFLKNNQLCKYGHVYDQEPGVIKGTCGRDVINEVTHLCCNVQPYERTSETTKCCGSDTYQSDYETCCNNQIVHPVREGTCCGDVIYNPNSETCCQTQDRHDRRGKVHSGEGLNDHCCGLELRADNQICVEDYGILVTKENPEDDSVCYDASSRRAPRHTTTSFSAVTYNSAENWVCMRNGALMRKYPGQEMCLLGAALYYPAYQICCMGHILAKYVDGAEHECCPYGTNSFNPLTQICFVNTVTAIGEEFCGKTTYNTTTHVCAEGMCIREAENAKHYPEFCGSDFNFYSCSKEENWYNESEKQCCDQTLYGAGETCCLGKVFRTPGTELGGGACCNRIAFNPSTHICCKTELYNIADDEGLACCGKRSFHPNDPREICCDDNLWSTEEGKSTCTGGVAHRPGETLCGNIAMDVATEICCQGMIYPKVDGTQCCGSTAFNANDITQLCCANNSLHTNAQGKECCRDQAIDPDTTYCCVQGGQEVGYSRDLAATSCCQEGSYDKTQHTCCDGVLHIGVANGECCGVEVVRNAAKERCCGGKLQQTYNNAICCQGRIYDGNLYTCCGETALHKYSSYEECCNGAVINIHEKTCNQGDYEIISTASVSTDTDTEDTFLLTTADTKVPNRNTSTSFTISDPKSPSTQTFSDTNSSSSATASVTETSSSPTDSDTESHISTALPIRPTITASEQIPETSTKQHSLCGNIQYDNSTSQCCNEQIIEFTSRRKCCSNVIFNTRRQKCINGEVISKSDCTTCDRRVKAHWKEKVCSQQFLFLVKLISAQSNDKRIVLEARQVTRLDRTSEQWQNEFNDVKIITKGQCKCKWIPWKIEKEGTKDFLIMTDRIVNERGRLKLSSDDYVVEADAEMFGEALITIVRECAS